jgi:hypothetical protein
MIFFQLPNNINGLRGICEGVLTKVFVCSREREREHIKRKRVREMERGRVLNGTKKEKEMKGNTMKDRKTEGKKEIGRGRGEKGERRR